MKRIFLLSAICTFSIIGLQAQEWLPPGATDIVPINRSGTVSIGTALGGPSGTQLDVQGGQIGQIQLGTFGQFAPGNKWLGLGNAGFGGFLATTYGLGMTFDGYGGYYNLVRETSLDGSGNGTINMIAGFGARTDAETAPQRFVIRNITQPNGGPGAFKNILIANPIGSVGINADPASTFFVDATQSGSAFKNMTILNGGSFNPAVGVAPTFTALGQEGNSIVNDNIQGFRTQIGGSSAANLQVIRELPGSTTVIQKRTELSWQDLSSNQFLTANTPNAAAVAPFTVFDKFIIACRNNGNNPAAAGARLPVMTFQANARVGINTINPVSLSGATQVNLQVVGAVLANAALLGSDERLKKNIRTVEGAMAMVRQIRGTTYEFRQEEFPERNMPGGRNYGFIAQELTKIMPEAAQKCDDGFYAVNYDAVIPVLVEAMKEQDKVVTAQTAQITNLEQRLNELTRELEALRNQVQEGQSTTQRDHVTLNTGAFRLEQNAPNPFKNETVIRFGMPENTANASINVYDLNGKMLKSYRIAGTEGSISINGNDLTAGIYLYDLLVNGQQIAQRKMILTQ